eukprot:c4642_g1_i1 orf=110-562(+)
MREYSRLRAARDSWLVEEDCDHEVMQDGAFRASVDVYRNSEDTTFDIALFPLRGIRENGKRRGNGECGSGEEHLVDARNIDVVPSPERKGSRLNGLRKDRRLKRFASLRERWLLGIETDDEDLRKISKDVQTCGMPLQRAMSAKKGCELE